MADIYDEMINEYNAQKQNTQTQINNLAVEKQNVLDTYEKNYQNQLTDYNNIMNQQQNYIDTWANTQKETQQKQTDYNIGLINQAKQEAEKQTNAEIGNAYIDYQKGLNQFGGSAETLASQGLGGTGFAKNQDIAMNITYQNRVSSAKSALQKANTDYNNQIQQALLTNDAKLAEFALQQMEKSYLLALQGFEYKTTLENNRLSYIQNVNDSYFNKTNTLQGRLDSYNSTINSIRTTQHQEQLAEQQRQQALAAARSSGGGSRSSGGSSSGVYGFTDTTPTASTPTTTKGQSLVTQVANLAKSDIAKFLTAANTPVSANKSLKLSSSKANSWFNNNMGTKSFTPAQVKSLVNSAYNQGIITTSDKNSILAAYGVK